MATTSCRHMSRVTQVTTRVELDFFSSSPRSLTLALSDSHQLAFPSVFPRLDSLSCPLPNPALPLNMYNSPVPSLYLWHLLMYGLSPPICVNTHFSQLVQSSSSSPLFAPPQGATIFLYAVRHFSVFLFFFKADQPSEALALARSRFFALHTNCGGRLGLD
jgi:hypothetical protein